MRYISTNCLIENMVSGENIYSNNKKLLVKEGQHLTKNCIRKIKESGNDVIYINDSAIYKDYNNMSNNFKHEVHKAIESIFGKTSITTDNNENTKENECVIDDIIDNVINNRNIVISLQDIRAYDRYTFYHSLNVAILSLVFGITLGLDKEGLNSLFVGALLHDIGKVFIKDGILNKPDKLSLNEFKKMKSHPKKGFEYINKYYQDIPLEAKMGILEHHERCDGSGYPYKKKDNEISLFGKIIAIADVYDAMMSDRPYRKRLRLVETIDYLENNAGVLFDLQMTKLFIQNIVLERINNNNYTIKCFNKHDLNIEPIKVS